MKARFEMPVRELSWEERNRLEGIAAAFAFATLMAFFAYLVYLMENNLLPTTWDALWKWGLPLMIGCFLAFMVTFEVGYHLKVKSPWGFQLKRIGGQLVLILLIAFSFVGFVGLMDRFLSTTLGRGGFMIGSFIWAVSFTAVMLKFRRTVAKLANGSW